MHPQVHFIVVHLSIVVTLAIAGNIFFLFVILRGNHVLRRRISPVQLLLIHTSVADILYAIMTLGTEIATMIYLPSFFGPDWICKLMKFCQIFPMYASPFLLVAISADRYQAICRPLVNFRSSRYRRPNLLAAIAWILSLLLSIPQIFIWGIKINEKNIKEGCAPFYGSKQHIVKYIYVIVFNTVAWLLPSILAAAFYYCVCKAVWMSNSKPQSIMRSDVKLIAQRSDVTQEYIDKLRKKSCGFRRQSSEFDRKRIQTVRLTMTIIACNFFLWMPFCLVNVILAVWPGVFSRNLIIFVMILGNLNSCVNPWIYLLFNRSHVINAFCRSKKNAHQKSEADMTSSFKPTFRSTGSIRLSSTVSEGAVRIHRNVSFKCGTKLEGGRMSSYKSPSGTGRPLRLVRNNSTGCRQYLLRTDWNSTPPISNGNVKE